jgi:hypothetical protein
MIRKLFVLAAVLAPISVHAQETRVKDLGDCRKHPRLCAGTHPMMNEILSKAPPESPVHQRALFCQPLPLAMQVECIEANYKRHLVEKRPGVFEFAPPKSTAIPNGWKAAAPVRPLDGLDDDQGSTPSSSAICRDRWKSDYVMREFCDNQMRAARGRSGY